jgi:hypothetical protein
MPILDPCSLTPGCCSFPPRSRAFLPAIRSFSAPVEAQSLLLETALLAHFPRIPNRLPSDGHQPRGFPMFFSHISLSVRSLFPYPNPLSKDEKRSSALEFRPVGWVSGWDSPTKIERKRSCSALFRSKDEKREHCILRGSLVTSEKYCSSDCLLAEENVTCEPGSEVVGDVGCG